MIPPPLVTVPAGLGGATWVDAGPLGLGDDTGGGAGGICVWTCDSIRSGIEPGFWCWAQPLEVKLMKIASMAGLRQILSLLIINIRVEFYRPMRKLINSSFLL